MLFDEAQKMKESNENLVEKISELKREKNELRDEKQRLKTEKENLDRQVKALSSQPSYLPHPPAIPAPFSAPGQVGAFCRLSWSLYVAIYATCCC
ncbi:hypothetical protein Ddye_019291 [Dipteronia dyeriana]|uniref:Uncharacterized protein n=1 Tax=Dipteronia dyeriana TaxID=168575 RepID=A0AAD9TXP7_9ROSI|nr:hypothetical protein Ddye_019291 [Dipteronia dyeriana]